MADDSTVVDDPQAATQSPSAEDQSVLAEARRGGWRPKDQWHGDPSEWVDAPTFVKRGRELLPHLSRHNEQLRAENEQLRQQQQTHTQELKELREQVAGLTEFRADVAKRQREDGRRAALEELAAARQAGDVEGELRILDRLTRPPEREPEGRQTKVNGSGATPPGGTAAASPPAIPQEMRDWVGANPWYGEDPVLQMAMNRVGAELRASGRLAGMSLTQQLNATAKVVLQRYQSRPGGATQSVEGRGRPAGGSPASGGGDGFDEAWANLPAALRQECDEQGQQLGLVGPKKTFKDLPAWRKYWLDERSRYAEGVGYETSPPGARARR